MITPGHLAELCAWKVELHSRYATQVLQEKSPFTLPTFFLTTGFGAIVRDQGQLYLRAAPKSDREAKRFRWSRVKHSTETYSRNWPKIWAKSRCMHPPSIHKGAITPAPTSAPLIALDTPDKQDLAIRTGRNGVSVDRGREELHITFTAGTLPLADNLFDP